MSAPFIVRSVSRIHPGKADAYRPVAAEFCRLVEERERGLLGFHIYVSEARTSEVVVQIHPDAESMQRHLEVMGEKVRETFAFADFESEIYGEPSEKESSSASTRCTGAASLGSSVSRPTEAGNRGENVDGFGHVTIVL